MDKNLQNKIIEFVKNSKKNITRLDIVGGVGGDIDTVYFEVGELIERGVLRLRNIGGRNYVVLADGA